MNAKPEYAEIKNDPKWIEAISKLPWAKTRYGGIVLAGECPACQHSNAIKVFVPTTWVNGVDTSSVSSPAPATKGLELDELVLANSRAKVVTPKQLNSTVPVEVVLCRCSEVHENTPTGKSGCGRWGYVVVQEVR